ncbi:hypothetical protein BDP27DRAFT_1428396 [Rhodocollybia butyracea]|uniref:Uncharacterized protein n=1 Tax=Rhodocollybia butyracea TaxID=206335 RepID=A0A9P5PET9_9AGAR|nr:hypothetical protein BDP27DRAFT_1428396 [Rhodocollybia butyracea]
MSSKFSDVFPTTLPLKSPLPFRNDVQQGFRTPQYLLGWVIRLSEAAALLSDGPRHGDPISLVASWSLSARWPEVRSKYLALHKPNLGLPIRYRIHLQQQLSKQDVLEHEDGGYPSSNGGHWFFFGKGGRIETASFE